MARISAIILGAGLSQRMGKENKLFLTINGKPMIEWVIESVTASSVSEVIIVGSELSMDKLEKWKSASVKVVENKKYKSGMTSSIQTGVNSANGDGYMICLGDQPNIQTSTYDQLIKAFNAHENKIVLPFFEGRKGNPSIFPSQFRGDILQHKDPEGCRAIIQGNKSKIYKVEVSDPGVLMDIDTPQDYHQSS